MSQLGGWDGRERGTRKNVYIPTKPTHPPTHPPPQLKQVKKEVAAAGRLWCTCGQEKKKEKKGGETGGTGGGGGASKEASSSTSGCVIE